jgi:hypothetical protein
MLEDLEPDGLVTCCGPQVRVQVEEGVLPADVTEELLESFLEVDVVDDKDTKGPSSAKRGAEGPPLSLADVTRGIECAVLQGLYGSALPMLTGEEGRGRRGDDDAVRGWGHEDERPRASKKPKVKRRGVAKAPGAGEEGHGRGGVTPPASRTSTPSPEIPSAESEVEVVPPVAGAVAGSKAAVAKQAHGPHKMKGQQRKRSVAHMLREGGWTLVRHKKHYVYKRLVRLGEGGVREQTFTCAATPSDRFAYTQQVKKLKGLNLEAALLS